MCTHHGHYGGAWLLLCAGPSYVPVCVCKRSRSCLTGLTATTRVRGCVPHIMPLADQLAQVLQLLLSCSRSEEECRNVVAECFGRLALMSPSGDQWADCCWCCCLSQP
jgi:hypothetical protein